jgi:hypothetical protein
MNQKLPKLLQGLLCFLFFKPNMNTMMKGTNLIAVGTLVPLEIRGIAEASAAYLVLDKENDAENQADSSR